MDASRVTAQITAFITNAIESPFAFLLWLVGTIAIVSVACTVLAPLWPSVIRPAGDVQKWVYIAGFVWLMKGAGR